MRQRIVMYGMLLLAGGVLAGGCTGGGGGGTAAGGAAKTRALAPAERGDSGIAGSGAREKTASLRLAPRGRSVIYTATVVVRADDVAKMADKAKTIATRAGGYVASERTSADPDHRDRTTARLTLKVPVDRYPSVLHRLTTDLGTRVSLRQRARDVTEEVADVDSRVRSARATLERLRGLLAKADTVGQVLKVEQEISDREADLEALEARQKALDSRTSYATITLRLESPLAATHVERAGFLPGLSAGWAAFRTTVVWLLTAIGAVAPFLVVIGAVTYAGWRAYRLLRRHHAATGSPH